MHVLCMAPIWAEPSCWTLDLNCRFLLQLHAAVASNMDSANERYSFDYAQ